MRERRRAVGGVVRGKILLVEDNTYTREIFATMVEHLGFCCVTANDGCEGVAKALSESPDVIFMDYMMPLMDGLDATRGIKAQSATAHIPVVIFTAVLGEEILSAAAEAGATTVLVKPASMNAIDHVLCDCLVELSFTFNSRGIACHERGDFAQALANYQEAMRLNPSDALAFNNRGVTRRALGDLPGALADYDEALRLKPDYATAYSNRGLVRTDLGDAFGALADYTEAIHLGPRYPLACDERTPHRSSRDSDNTSAADLFVRK